MKIIITKRQLDEIKKNRFQLKDTPEYRGCLMSDLTRMELIEDFLDKQKADPNYNTEDPDYDMLLDDWDGYDDQVYIQNILDNNTIVFYEGWVDSCWSAVYNTPQYKGMSESEVIESIVTNRFPRIGEEFNMVIKDYGYFYDGGYIMYVVFKKI
jgi:hypothetical protein